LQWIQDYAAYEHAIASLQLALAMLGMGALLTLRDFRGVVENPRGLATGLLLQLALVPLVASLLARALPIGPGLVAGVVLVAAIPGGTMSNLLTYLARGNIALSISLTAVTTLAALVTTPALLGLLAGAHLPPDFDLPVGRVAREIAVSLLLPLGLGMLAGRLWPTHREALSRNAIRASLLAIGFLVVGAAGSGRIDPRSYGVWGVAALVLLAAAFGATAWLVSRATGLRSHERLALTIEAVLRNGNLGVLVKASLFPAVAGRSDPIGDAMLFAVLVYGGIGLLAALLPTWWHRRHGEAWHAHVLDAPGR
jgi:BASS family bile acid:Na+ symporter